MECTLGHIFLSEGGMYFLEIYIPIIFGFLTIFTGFRFYNVIWYLSNQWYLENVSARNISLLINFVVFAGIFGDFQIHIVFHFVPNFHYI